ncbi:MAG: ATP synthase subunit C [Thioalkalivibrio sp.]|nr:ATP synthase subunit C [Thioalkalivibrio sp.]
MHWLVGLMSFAIVGLIAAGFYLEFQPALAPRLRNLFKPALAVQMTVFVGAIFGMLALGIGDAMAQPAVAEQVVTEVSVGLGLAIIGVGIPTALSTIGAAIAVGPIGSAALAAITEKPEMLGRSLIYIGLAEGIAIYGLVVSILLLNRI